MKTDKPRSGNTVALAASYLLAVVLLLVPFQAFLTIYVSTLVGHYDLVRLWKEMVLLALIPPALYIVWQTPALKDKIRPMLGRSWLFWLITAYVGLQAILGVMALVKGQVNSYALLYAWVINLRPLLIFVLALIFASQSAWLHDHWKRLLLWPAVVVIGFGLLQFLVLPHNFLSHFGYGTATIEPYETVDSKEDYLRVQSTLRGANPLGAYLVLVLAAILVAGRVSRREHLRNAGLFTLGSIVLFATYSRSAYIGMVLTVLAAVILAVRSRQAKRRLWFGLAALAVLAAGTLGLLRDNDRFENTFFHTNEQSQSATSSNQQRSTALLAASRDVLHEPFGRGPGTAGPASAHNDRPARIAENYYLQIAQETGWLGLALFLAIVVLIAKKLWRQRSQPLARTLLISLIGISFINLVQHAWADDTLALVWWGFAGIALAATESNHLKQPTKLSRLKKLLAI